MEVGFEGYKQPIERLKVAGWLNGCELAGSK
jgi:hypothetical protein